MGRYYSGSIEGKMWFGVQNSADPSQFGVEPTDEYSFYGCECCANDYVTLSEKDATIFCENCYDSLDDHLEKTEEDREDEMTFYGGNEISYSFDTNDLPKLNKVIKKLEKRVGSFMTNYKIIDANGSICYEYKFPENIPNEKEFPYIARLCLGRQILYCIDKNEYCDFVVEC